MSIAKDPLFRSQYEQGVQPDPEVEQLLYGSHPVRIPPSVQPMKTETWLPGLKPVTKPLR